MKIRVDNREKEEVLVEFVLLQEKLEKRGIEVELTRENLVCGDVVVGDVCFERKEAGDFIASMIDHRVISEAEKMALNFKHNYIIFVGDIWETSSMIEPKAITGMQASLIIRYNVHLMHVKNNFQFAWAVYTVVNKLMDGKVFNPAEHEIFKYEVTSQNRFVSMLAAAGIGVERAKKIAEYCGYDMKALLDSMGQLTTIDGVGASSIKKLNEVLLNGG